MRRFILAVAVGMLASSGLAPLQVALAGPAAGGPRWASLQDSETELVNSINDLRDQYGLPPLIVDPELTQIALYRSNDQAQRHYFSHITPDGQDVFDLLDQAGVNYTYAGENLAEADGPDPAQTAMDGFINSPPHLANLLSSDFNYMGVGAADSSDGFTIITVVFTN